MIDLPTKIDLRPDKTEYLTDEEVSKFFVPPDKEIGKITRIRNTFIVGHKGSGKSIILRYLSLPLQLNRIKSGEMIPFDTKSVGIFLRCDVGKFGGMTENPTEDLDKNWIKHFTHTFNLSILSVLLEHIQIMHAAKQFALTQNEILDFLGKISNLAKVKFNSFNLDVAIQSVDEEIDSLQEEYQDNQLAQKSRHYTDTKFLFEVRKILQKSISYFKNREPVFLLDEYNELSIGQQRVINDMLKLRHPIFKMSSIPHGYTRTRASSNSEIDIDQDFDVVFLANKELMSSSRDFISTKNLLSNVWNKRILPLSLGSRTIERILSKPIIPPKDPNKKKTKAHFRRINEFSYSGFDNYVLLSSGNPKTFLDLLQITIDKACENNINIVKDDIPTSTQLESIMEFSKERRNDIVTADTQYGRNLQRFVEYVGKFLKKKNTETNRDYRLISVKNDEQLSDLSYETITLGLKKSWLIQKNLERISRTEKIRLKTLTLNNLLIPSFELPLSSQQNIEMDAKLIDSIISGLIDQRNEAEAEGESPVTKEPAVNKSKIVSPIPLEAYDYLDDIKKLIQKDQIIFFVGSGLSTNAGLPSATDLKNALCAELEINTNDVGGLDDVAELFVSRRSDFDLREFLQNQFEKVIQPNIDLHKKLVSTGVSKIITTNWDVLLEDSFKALGEPYRVIVDQNELGSYDEKIVGIFKIHGDLSHSNLLVATKSQYHNYSITHEFMITRVKSLLQNRGVLFVGYSLNDFNFQQVRSTVLHEMGSMRSSYAIFPNINPNQKLALEKKGFKIITSDFKPIINSFEPARK